MYRRAFFVVPFLLFHALAFATHKEYFYYLQGAVGTRSIAIKIEQYDQLWFAKFFYGDTKKDIFLRGTCDSLGCKFSSYRWDPATNKQVVRESFFITEQPDHTWKGEWVDSSKKIYPLLLHPVKRDQVQHLYGYQPVARAMDPYSYLRTSNLRFIKTRTETFDGHYKIEWQREPLSGLEFPRITKGIPKNKRDSINKTLEGIHLKEVENYFSCSAVGRTGEYTLKTEFTFINTDLMSMLKEITYNCQSEQPTTEKLNLTFDVATGQILALENIFWMVTGTPPPAESQPWYEYRYSTFGSSIKSILKELYPEQMKPGQECNYDDPAVWQFPTWYLTKKGLFLGAVFPGIDHHCDTPGWAIIPYEKLRRYQNPVYHF